jgi:hypothetical protein
MREQSVKLRLHPSCRLVQGPSCRCAEEDVQTHGEDAFVAALQRIAQALGVLQTDIPFGIGDALREYIDAPRRLEFRDLETQGADHVPGCQWPQVMLI